MVNIPGVSQVCLISDLSYFLIYHEKFHWKFLKNFKDTNSHYCNIYKSTDVKCLWKLKPLRGKPVAYLGPNQTCWNQVAKLVNGF